MIILKNDFGLFLYEDYYTTMANVKKVLKNGGGDITENDIYTLIKMSSRKTPALEEAIDLGLFTPTIDHLHLAIYYRNEYSVRVFLEKGHIEFGFRTLDMAVETGNFSIVKMFSQYGEIRPRSYTVSLTTMEPECTRFLLENDYFDLQLRQLPLIYKPVDVIVELFRRTQSICMKFILYDYLRKFMWYEKMLPTTIVEETMSDFERECVLGPLTRLDVNKAICEFEKDEMLAPLLRLREKRATRILKAFYNPFNNDKFVKEQHAFFSSLDNANACSELKTVDIPRFQDLKIYSTYLSWTHTGEVPDDIPTEGLDCFQSNKVEEHAFVALVFLMKGGKDALNKAHFHTECALQASQGPTKDTIVFFKKPLD